MGEDPRIFFGNFQHFRCKESITEIANESIPLERFSITSKLSSCWKTPFPRRSPLYTGKLPYYCPMESSLPTIWKLPSQEKALFPLLSRIPTENLPSHLKSGKLPSHWKAAFPLRRSLLNIKLLFYWEPNFPHWESSFILGSSLPVPTGNLFPSHLEALFPLESSLPIRKLHYHWEAPTRKSLVSGKLPCHWKSEKPSSH